MSKRRLSALMLVVSFLLVLAPLHAVYAADALPRLMITELIPNGKNVVDPATGKQFNEAFELIEIYNHSSQDIALKDFKIMYGPSGSEYELPWLEDSVAKVIPAGGVVIVWPKQNGNPFTVANYYEHNQKKNPDLKIEQVAVVLGQQMHNSAPRGGYLAALDGTVICKFAYDGVSTETVDDKAIRYAYPTDGSIQLRKISFGTPSTPGILDADQQPAAQ